MPDQTAAVHVTDHDPEFTRIMHRGDMLLSDAYLAGEAHGKAGTVSQSDYDNVKQGYEEAKAAMLDRIEDLSGEVARLSGILSKVSAREIAAGDYRPLDRSEDADV